MTRKPRPKRKRSTPPVLSNAVIEHYLERAAKTVKEVEQNLQSSFKIPASTLTLRIQLNR